MLLGKLNLHALKDFLCATLKGGIEHTITINDNESEFLVVLEQGSERFSIEGVLAAVSELVDLLEGFDVNCNLLFSLAIADFNYTAEKHQAIWWH